MQDLSLICICKQKTFSPVLLINLSQKDKALPVKNFQTEFRHLLRVFREQLA